MKKGGQLEEILAFDNGPGNMMINEAMKVFYHKEYDENGEIAHQGTVIETLLRELMSHPF